MSIQTGDKLKISLINLKWNIKQTERDYESDIPSVDS